ncbi:MAG: tetratricopeptide repeat protein [bacterium]
MKRNLIFLLLAVIIGTAIGLVLYLRYQRSSALFLAKGHLDKGRWQEALSAVDPVYRSNSRDLESALVIGQAKWGLGETDDALAALAPFLPPSGKEPAALDFAGWIYLDNGDAQTAADLFTQLGELPDQEANSLVGLAAAKMVESGGYSDSLISEARHVLNLALARAPRSGRGHLVLGEIALAERNFQEAASAAEQAIRWLDNPSRAYLLRGRIRLAERQYQQAQADFRQALALGAPNAAVQRQLALIEYHQGNVSQTVSLLENAPKTNTPEGIHTILDLAALYTLGGDLSKAIDLLAPLAAKSGDPTFLLQLYELYAAAGRHEEGSRILHDLTRRSPFFTAGLIEQTAKAWRDRDMQTVRGYVTRTYDSNPDNIWGVLFQGTAALLDRDPRRALDYFETLRQQDGVPLSGILNMTLSYLMLERAEDADDLLNRVVALRGDPRFSRILALTRQHLGDLKQALADFKPTEDAEDVWLHSQLLLRAYRFDEAEQEFTQDLTSAHPSSSLLKAIFAAIHNRDSEAEMHIARFESGRTGLDPAFLDWAELIKGYCAAVSGRRARAMELLNPLVSLPRPISDPAKALTARLGETEGGVRVAARLDQDTGVPRKNAPFSSFETALSFERSGRRDEAIQLYRTLLSDTPFFPPAVDHLAYLLWFRGNTDAAREQYQILLDLGCEPKMVRRNLACLAWEEGDQAHADELFASASEAGVVDEDLNVERCLLELCNGRIVKAQELLEPLRQSTSSAVLAAQGYLAAAKEDWSTAGTLLQRASAKRPDDSWVWMNYGIALVHLERHTEAEQAFRRVIELVPGLAEGHRLLGQLYANRGLYREAHRSLSTALRLNPNQPRVKQTLDRIGGWIGEAGV